MQGQGLGAGAGAGAGAASGAVPRPRTGPSIADIDRSIRATRELLLAAHKAGEKQKVEAAGEMLQDLQDARDAATTGAGLAVDGGSLFSEGLAETLRERADASGFVVVVHLHDAVLAHLRLDEIWSRAFLPTAKKTDGSDVQHELGGAAHEGGGGLLALIASKAQLEAFLAAGGQRADVLCVHVESLIFALSGQHDKHVWVAGPRGGKPRSGCAAGLCVWAWGAVTAMADEPLEVAQVWSHEDPKTRAFVAWLQLLRPRGKKGKGGICLIVLAMAIAYGLVCAHPNAAGCSGSVRFNTRGELSVKSNDLVTARKRRVEAAAWGIEDWQDWFFDAVLRGAGRCPQHLVYLRVHGFVGRHCVTPVSLTGS